MVIQLIKLLPVLAVLVGSILYVEGYLGDIGDPEKGTRICRRRPDEVDAWSGHATTRRPEHLAELAEWARKHPDRVNRLYGASCSTALHLAAEFGREDAARVLLAHGAHVDARTQLGDTPLHRAAWYGHPTLVKLLLAHGADVDARDSGGMTPLHEVMTTTRAEIPLEARLAVARTLLDAGADPNRPDRASHFTPLRYAVSSQGDPALARLLLERGAMPNRADAQGSTPLDEAAAQGDLETVRLLLDHGAELDRSALPAAARGHLEVVRLLLERGANPNRPSFPLLPWYGVPLEFALVPAHAGPEDAPRRLEIAALLVESGADVNVRGRGGRTLLHGGAQEGNLASTRFLLDHGADVGAIDSNGMTPLHAAVEQGYIDIAELLIARGSDPNAAATDGVTPLALARIDPEMEELIRRHGGR